MAIKIVNLARRGTEAEWTASSYIPQAGEFAFATDTNTLKIGTGSKTWSQLTAVNDSALAAQFVSAIASGSSNGTIAVTKDGTTTNVAVKGLGTAAYTASTAYATAAQGAKADTAVQSVASGSTNGTISVDGTDVSVKGLGTAAYTATSAYATATQGAKADTAVQSVATGSSNGTIAVDGTDVSVKGLGTAAYTASTAYATAAQGTLATNAMPKSGGTFTGAVTLNADPTSNLHAATKQYVDNTLADAISDVVQFDVQVVTTLPTTGTKGVIYLISDSHGTNDVYDEYLWTGSAFEKIGNTDIDLSGYVPTTRTINSKALSANITLSASDVGADASGTASNLIAALDVTDTAVSGQYVSAVSETNGKIAVTRATLPTYSLPTATSSVLGGVKLGSDTVITTTSTVTAAATGTASRIYPVQVNSDGQLVASVPWSNTTYSVATTSTNGLMSSSDKSKLDGIASGAQANVIESITAGGTAVTITDKVAALGAAAAKAVDTSISASTTSTNLPTSAAVEARINAHSGIDKVGTVTSVTAGTGITIGGTAAAPTVAHSTISTTGPTSSDTVSTSYITGLTVSNGHVTKVTATSLADGLAALDSIVLDGGNASGGWD